LFLFEFLVLSPSEHLLTNSSFTRNTIFFVFSFYIPSISSFGTRMTIRISGNASDANRKFFWFVCDKLESVIRAVAGGGRQALQHPIRSGVISLCDVALSRLRSFSFIANGND
jgi:hypothetical protein